MTHNKEYNTLPCQIGLKDEPIKNNIHNALKN